MSWEKVREHVDEAQGTHTMFLEDRASQPPARHQLTILLGPRSCPLCGHATPFDNLGEIDPKAVLEREIAALEEASAAKRAYRLKHKIPGRKP